MSSHSHRRAPQRRRSHPERNRPERNGLEPNRPVLHQSSGFLRRDSMRPAYRTGSSSQALTAARRTQLRRGLVLVLGSFLLYALVSCLLPGLMPLHIPGGFRVGELAAAAQVLVIALAAFLHDRHARRHVEPLAQRVARRQPAGHVPEFTGPWTGGADTPGAAPEKSGGETGGETGGESGGFNAFDSSRAFGGGRTHSARPAARATT